MERKLLNQIEVECRNARRMAFTVHKCTSYFAREIKSLFKDTSNKLNNLEETMYIIITF